MADCTLCTKLAEEQARLRARLHAQHSNPVSPLRQTPLPKMHDLGGEEFAPCAGDDCQLCDTDAHADCDDAK